MKHKLLFLLVFCLLGIQTTKADIVNPDASGSYFCNGDGTVTVTITTTYETTTIEWFDCVQFTFPAGWTYVPGGEGGSALGWDQGSAGNIANFGNDPNCPTFSAVMYGSWGGSPNVFTFIMQPPAGFNTGVCEDAGDGDAIPFTWTYLGDGYGNVGPAAPGTNSGDPVTQTDIVDAGVPPPPPPCNAGELIACQDSITYCIASDTAFTIDAIGDTLTIGGLGLFFADTYLGNGVTQTGSGALAGGFTLTGVGAYPYTADADLNGVLAANGLPPLGGTWYIAGVAYEEDGVTICDATSFVAVNFNTDPACLACEATTSTISTTDPTTICVDGVPDPIDVSIDDLGCGDGAWVITDSIGTILALPPGPPFDLDGAGVGTCLIWYVNSDDPNFAPAVGDDAPSAVAAACAALSNPITVVRQTCGGGNCNDLSYTAPTQACSGDDIILTAPVGCDFTGIPGTSPLDPGAAGTYPIFVTNLTTDPVANTIDFSALDIGGFIAANPVNGGFFVNAGPCEDFLTFATNVACDPLYLHINVVILDGDATNGLFVDGCVSPYTIEILPQPGAPSLEASNCQTVLTGSCPSDIITITGGNGTGTSGATATYDLLPATAPGDTLTVSVSNGVCTTDFFFVPDSPVGPALTCPATASCGATETLSADLVPEEFGFLEVLITEVDPAVGGDTYLDEFSMDVNGVTVIPIGFFTGGGGGPTTQSATVGPFAPGSVTVDIFDSFGDGLSYPFDGIVTITDQGSGAVILTAQGNYGAGPVSGSGTITPSTSTSGVWSGMGVTDNGDGTAAFTMGMNGTFTATYTYTDLIGCTFTETCDITISDCMMGADPTIGLSDPCNCANGIDLDNDGVVDLVSETIVITPGTAPYTVTNYSGGLTDMAGVPLTLADIQALFDAAVPDADGNVSISAYLPADGVTVFSIDISDSNGATASFTKPTGCPSCVNPDEVPTVGEWGLIILGLLMTITAVIGIRQRRKEEVYV